MWWEQTADFQQWRSLLHYPKLQKPALSSFLGALSMDIYSNFLSLYPRVIIALRPSKDYGIRDSSFSSWLSATGSAGVAPPPEAAFPLPRKTSPQHFGLEQQRNKNNKRNLHSNRFPLPPDSSAVAMSVFSFDLKRKTKNYGWSFKERQHVTAMKLRAVKSEHSMACLTSRYYSV